MSASTLPSPSELAAVLTGCGLDPNTTQSLDGPPAARGHVLAHMRPGVETSDEIETIIRASDDRMSREGALVLWREGDVSDEELATWRNAAWPALHATGLCRVSGGRARHRTLKGPTDEDAGGAPGGTLLVLHRRDWVQSPEATVAKFDQNASGWNGEPGRPGYAHFRWMRRLVGQLARPKSGQRVLDFGCGAGWCGIESLEGIPNVALRSFDPSPEMVKIAESNAKAEGIGDFKGRTGFGSAPPFPAEGEEPFDLVISSGVISFAPDVEAFLEGIAATVRPGGTLVIGDINVGSRGFRTRRRTKPLLPVREMNAQSVEETRAWLERRGFHHRETLGYQLTWPVPEAMHLSERKLKGLLNPPLLAANRIMTALDRATNDAFRSQFDSWVMRFDAPEFMGVTVGSPNSKFVYDEDGNKRPREASDA